MLDLKGLRTKETATTGVKYQLRHPGTDEPMADAGKPVTITLAGQDSTQYRTALRKRSARMIAEAQGTRRRKGPSESEAEVMAEQAETDTLAMIVACTLAWERIGFEEAELACTPENAAKLYTECPWIREQAEAFVADRANFLPASKTT